MSQAGLVNNLNDGMAWGLFPLWFAASQLDLSWIGILAALYPATWGVALGAKAAIEAVAGLTFVSGAFAAWRMSETLRQSS